MENHTNTHSSHPNSRDSSPRSRELMESDTITTTNNNNNGSSFDEPPPSVTYRVKLLCSYGGKIQPRPHDNQLAYVGGDTKILALDRNVKFSTVLSKLSSLANSDVCFKYQLPGEDLDALISVTNDEDLDHMMIEYDRLSRASPKPARLRLFLFSLNSGASGHFVSPTVNLAVDSKPERQWFVDALNSVQVPPREGSYPPPPPPNPDFLFGLDKPYQTAPAAKAADSPRNVPDFSAAGSECGSETVRETEIPELQKLQLGNNNEQQRKSDGENERVYGGSEKVTPLPLVTHAPGRVHSGSFPVQGSGPVSFNGYHHPSEPTPVYLIQTQNGIYQAVRPVTGPVGQPVYFIQTPHSQLGSEVGGGVVSERGGYSYFPDRSALPRQAAAAPGGDGWN